jgi:hypothetical protein
VRLPQLYSGLDPWRACVLQLSTKEELRNSTYTFSFVAATGLDAGAALAFEVHAESRSFSARVVAKFLAPLASVAMPINFGVKNNESSKAKAIITTTQSIVAGPKERLCFYDGNELCVVTRHPQCWKGYCRLTKT